MYAELTKKIKDYTSKINTTTFVMFAIIIIFISVAIYLGNSKFKPKFNDNLENENDSNNHSQAELMMFSVDWCPHCKKAKTIWEELKQEYEY
jgi:thioredoxin-related protein